MFGKLKNKAKELSSSNDTDNEMGSTKINEIIQSQWPKIEGILLERMIPLAGDKLNNHLLK
jgi:hypothetical protein